MDRLLDYKKFNEVQNMDKERAIEIIRTCVEYCGRDMYTYEERTKALNILDTILR